jgi:adenine deaminase
MRFSHKAGELRDTISSIKGMELINAANNQADTGRIILKGGRVIDPFSRTDKILDLAIKDGRIESVNESISPKRGDAFISVQGLMVIPGLVDLHLHIHDLLQTPSGRLLFWGRNWTGEAS